jgi:ferredoxin
LRDPISIDMANRRIATSPELADACFTCGTCASGCPATNLVPGWDPRKAIRAIALESNPGHSLGIRTGSNRFQMALGLHPLRPLPVCMPHGGSADQDLPDVPDYART